MAVAVFGLFIVIGLLFVLSVPDMLPVQFLKTNCVPVVPGTRPVVIDAYAVAFSLYHPEPLGVP